MRCVAAQRGKVGSIPGWGIPGRRGGTSLLVPVGDSDVKIGVVEEPVPRIGLSHLLACVGRLNKSSKGYNRLD